MASIKRGISYLVHNRRQFCDSLVKNYFKWLPDKLYLSLRYRFTLGHWMNWEKPETFTEKIQWLKIYNRRPYYSTMVDKWAVKNLVEKSIGKNYIIPTIAVWENLSEINWDLLPNQFVLKTTHGGGGSGVVICKGKKHFDKDIAIKKLSDSLSKDIYSNLREWPYQNVTKRIIAEEYISGENGDLNDYKFFCFDGKVKFFKIDFGRFVEHHANYYSPDGKLLEFGEKGLEPDPEYDLKMPSNLQEMIAIAEKLSKDEPFLRVDLYNISGRIIFGELTFYPASGLIPWTKEEADMTIGSYLNLK